MQNNYLMLTPIFDEEKIETKKNSLLVHLSFLMMKSIKGTLERGISVFFNLH